MSGDLLLGIDIGTYSAKGVLCAPDGEVLAEATIEHGHSLPRPGWVEHDADAIWWGELVGLMRQLLDDRYSGDRIASAPVLWHDSVDTCRS